MKSVVIGGLVALAVLLSFGKLPGASVPNAENILLNPDFKLGKGDFPDGWGSSVSPDGAARFIWHRDTGEPPSIEIVRTQRAEAKVEQSVNLELSTWYFLSADLRTESSSVSGLGAQMEISIGRVIFTTSELKGTTPWKTVGFYFKTADRSDGVIRCGFDQAGRANAGRMFVRKLSLTRSAVPPPGAAMHDFASLHEDWKGASPTKRAQWLMQSPLASRWSIPAIFSSLIVVLVVGWRMVTSADPCVSDKRRG